MKCSNCKQEGHNKRSCRMASSLQEPIRVSSRSHSKTDMPIVDKVHEYILSSTDTRIVLMRKKEVIMWLFGDLSFLPRVEEKNKKAKP